MNKKRRVSLPRGVRTAIILSLFFGLVAAALSQAGFISGVVATADNDAAVAGAKVSVDDGGSDQTTDSGKFTLSLSAKLKVGFPATFRVKDWVVIDPCVNARGRIYLPDPRAETIVLKVLRTSDSRLLSGSSIRCLVLEKTSQFKPESGSTSKSCASLSDGSRQVFAGCRWQLVTRGHASRHYDDDYAASLATPYLAILARAPAHPVLQEKGKDNQPVVDEFLAKQATELGFTTTELAEAIGRWAHTVEDPYEKGLAALYEGSYAEASAYISRSISSPTGKFLERFVPLARAEYEQGHYAAAAAALRAVLAVHSQDPLVTNGLEVVLDAEARHPEREQGQREIPLPPPPNQSPRAHQLAQQAPRQRPARCTSGLTLQQCHDKLPDGCSDAARFNYDAYLNFLKDQDPDPSLASTTELTASDFRSLESQLSHLSQSSRGGAKRRDLTSLNHAFFASRFADLGEGNIDTVIAYLYFAEDTGNPTAGRSPSKETCNCKLSAPNTFDYHVGVGFDPLLGSMALSTRPKEGDPLFSQLEKESVVVEITPYTRTTRHPNWTIDRVQALQGKQVKVVGQLMADNEHFNAKADCGFPGATTSCWRATIWEIHPIMKLYVCNLSSGCDASSPDSAWTDLDE